MSNFKKISIIFLLFLGIVAIRFFKTDLFYDPLIDFYEGNYLTQPPPKFEAWKLILHTSLRFWLNTLLSLLILWVAFQSKKIIRFSVAFFGISFIILIVLFAYFLFNMAMDNYFILFYLRRFLIQPLFIILLLPAFYYQKSISKQ